MSERPRIALVLGGGAARGLAHVGAIEVIERAGLAIDFLAGSSMGGLVGALHATGLESRRILEVARGFRFPAWFLPGALIPWERVFPTAARVLRDAAFERLARPLAVVATDAETGRPVVLGSGPVLPAVRATCAVPAVLPPERLDGRWLLDGGLVNLLPVDLAALGDPDVVVAVNIQASRQRSLPALASRWAAAGRWLGGVIPNPLTARAGFELLVRSAEIALDRQCTLAAAMVAPDVLVEAQVGTIGLRDFHRIEEAVEAGRRAMSAALPALRRQLDDGPRKDRRARSIGREIVVRVDPVCGMVVSPGRAARIEHQGETHHFCSPGCRDQFLEWTRTR